MMYNVYGIPAINLNNHFNIFEIVICYDKIVFYSYISTDFKFNETRIYAIDSTAYTVSQLQRRYNKMAEKEKNNIVQIPSELEDDYSDDSLFNIVSWGADLTFRSLADMYEENELVKPELQRKYVWDKVEASRFIESILLGLPVPSIFLAQAGSQQLIVDGYQRIMTIYDYMRRGIFSADNKVFKLSNSEKINERWRNKAFSELSLDDQRKIKSTTIHAIIFEQRKPENDDTSLYQVFERINTSGRSLTPQEIRNCVYQGTLNTLLFELNDNEKWRTLFGSVDADSRMRDLEYILRFYAMKTPEILESSSKQISLKKALNTFMKKHKNAGAEKIQMLKGEFERTIQLAYDHIGVNAFRNYSGNKFSKKFHPAIFDAIMISIFLIDQQGIEITDVSDDAHKALLENTEFKNAISKRTTDVENIQKRIRLAAEILFGVDLK